ncbi:sodium:calcium antiporter [Falsiroseomonas sp.]|uniref:sodium:calcium antiporter n=1 Tax=Falsiroseomonas sp. TaxID=2870721 RepID=UPI00356B3A1E
MQQLLADAPLWASIATLVAAAAAICFAGTRLAGVANVLADRTGMGEVIAGALFVGGATSLPGIITSVSTAWQGHAGLAIGNALGGLTVQTAFLAVADLFYRRANLEHAAASTVGLAQGTLLVVLLTLPLMAASGPDWTLLGMHPVTPILFAGYGAGLWLLAAIHEKPMWSPVMTSATQAEEVGGDAAREQGGGEDPTAGPYRDSPTRRLWLLFLLHAGITGAAGYAVGEASIALVGRTGLSETAVGTVFTAVANSLPELVTAVAAVRVGAVGLAVGDVIGGNSFEVLFLAAADIAWRDGSLYARFDQDNVFTAATALLMTGVLLLGMLPAAAARGGRHRLRERHGAGAVRDRGGGRLLLTPARRRGGICPPPAPANPAALTRSGIVAAFFDEASWPTGPLRTSPEGRCSCSPLRWSR